MTAYELKNIFNAVSLKPFKFKISLILIKPIADNKWLMGRGVFVMPAKAGIQVFGLKILWIPAFAGMTYSEEKNASIAQ